MRDGEREGEWNNGNPLYWIEDNNNELLPTSETITTFKM